MELRPHHLLCTQGYSGKGYSSEFVENMNRLTERLKSEEATKIQLKFSTDDLCVCCPNKKGDDLCSTNEKVKRFDRKTAAYFQLEEREYIYQELVREIQEKITPEMLEDICEGCSWYSVSACREKLLKRFRENPGRSVK